LEEEEVCRGFGVLSLSLSPLVDVRVRAQRVAAAAACEREAMGVVRAGGARWF
jgi:hypothetical protein